jgi:hypothetical protein
MSVSPPPPKFRYRSLYTPNQHNLFQLKFRQCRRFHLFLLIKNRNQVRVILTSLKDYIYWVHVEIIAAKGPIGILLGEQGIGLVTLVQTEPKSQGMKIAERVQGLRIEFCSPISWIGCTFTLVAATMQLIIHISEICCPDSFQGLRVLILGRMGACAIYLSSPFQ